MRGPTVGGQTVVEFALLDDAPDLGDEDRPKYKKANCRGHGLHAEDADMGFSCKCIANGFDFDL